MKSACVVILDRNKNPRNFEKVIIKCIDELRNSATSYISGSINDLNSYKKFKRNNSRDLFILIEQEFDDVNSLEYSLLDYYNFIRRLILEKEQNDNVIIPVKTQVLFNIPDLNIMQENGCYYYDWDLIMLQNNNKLNLKFKDRKARCIQYFDTNDEIKTKSDKIPNIYNENTKYSIGCVGGTFDHLHDGHKILLSMATFVSEHKLIIGVSNQDLLKNKKYVNFLESYEERCEKVQRFITNLKVVNFQIEIYELNDMYGPSGFIDNMDVLFVTEETAKGGKMVNQKRSEKHLKQMDIFVVKLILDDFYKDQKISSTFVREFQSEEYSRITKN